MDWYSTIIVCRVQFGYGIYVTSRGSNLSEFELSELYVPLERSNWVSNYKYLNPTKSVSLR